MRISGIFALGGGCGYGCSDYKDYYPYGGYYGGYPGYYNGYDTGFKGYDTVYSYQYGYVSPARLCGSRY
ncbi:MAG: hypothetical protein ACRDRP_20270 [Pseudonocardiaceae bacterium]